MAILEFDIVTLFPDLCRVPLGESIVGRAQESGLVSVRVHDLKDWATDRHRTVDDEPYGGGPGMVLMCGPIFSAVRSLKEEFGRGDTRVLLMTPQGIPLKQRAVRKLATRGGHFVVLCGHYEGIDQRAIDALVDEEISIGDYVLTNGGIAAVVLVDAMARLVPGVLGDERSAKEESFAGEAECALEAPHYTRPAEFEGMEVPEVLLSGDHARIARWKREEGLRRTKKRRPDLG
ncbi:MAG: tRNA (guanosine(37)-N1)-methyltransferase TrmD [Verrucomicrobiota bacterium]